MARRFALMALLVLAAATQIRLHASAQAAARRVEAAPIKTVALLVDRAKNPARSHGPVELAAR